LQREGDILLAYVELTPLGIEKIESKQFKFISAEFTLEYPHWETGEIINNVLTGVALTNIPAVKKLKPVQLSEQVKLYLNTNNMTDKELKNKKIIDDETSEDPNLKSEPEEKEELETEQKEEVKEEVKEEEKEDRNLKLAEKKAHKELLSEKEKEIQALSAKCLKLEEINKKQKLKANIEKNFLLSEKSKYGFVNEQLSEVLDFMFNLSAKQQEQFTKLFNAIKHVDLNVYGSSRGVSKAELTPDNVVELAEKLMKEGKASDIKEAQKMAIKKLS
jgi:hypothetical protein